MPEEPSFDIYPGKLPLSRGAHPADGFIAWQATKLLTTRYLDRLVGAPPQAPPPGSLQSLEELTEGLKEVDVDEARVKVGVAIVQLDLMRRFSLPNAAPIWTGPEGSSA